MSATVSAKYMVRPSGEKASPFETPMARRYSPLVPSGSTRCRTPEDSDASSCMDPTQNRPCRSHLPSLSRFAGPPVSRCSQSSVAPVDHSRNTRESSTATSRRSVSWVRAIDPGRPLRRRVRRSPMDGSKRLIQRPSMSIVYSTSVRRSHTGHSPRRSGSRPTTSITVPSAASRCLPGASHDARQ